jgi:excinuclease ABC subunit C
MASRPPIPPMLYDQPIPEGGSDRFSEEAATYAVRGVDTPNLDQGIEAIRAVVKTLPARPGVYRMLNAEAEVLYVGKARNLKARVGSYTQPNRQPNRILRMISQTRSMTIMTTNTEAEALLLEANVIKRFRPPYNVLLRDDKGFPYIYLREDHSFAQITKHRGAKKGKGEYYGPFASIFAVNNTLNTLQKVFQLRSCTDSFFQNRSRPCLLYQIKRCCGPCVERVTPDEYTQRVQEAKSFLSGKSSDAQKRLAAQMQSASDAMEFEKAVTFRDRLRALTYVQQDQGIHAGGAGDADVIALAMKGGICCIQIFFMRGGQNWGNRALFPRIDKSDTPDDVLMAFVAQFYEDKQPPKRILLDRKLPEMDLLADALSVRAEYRVSLEFPQRGPLTAVTENAAKNAAEALERKLIESASQSRHLAAVAEIFDLGEPPQRIEIYDNSHIQGAHATGAMVVAGPDGFMKNCYRKFNIKNSELTPGDDFGMMREVLTRRFARLVNNDPDKPDDESQTAPDLVLIDGGRGQLHAAMDVLAELGIEDVPLVGIAKGPDRNAGREIFHLPNGSELSLEVNSPALFYIQRLRDEAHRFAIGTHRNKRSKAIESNPLDEVPGIGPSRKKALLMHFGSGRAVQRAAMLDLQKVDGISDAMARTIYEHFHPQGR